MLLRGALRAVEAKEHNAPLHGGKYAASIPAIPKHTASATSTGSRAASPIVKALGRAPPRAKIVVVF